MPNLNWTKPVIASILACFTVWLLRIEQTQSAKIEALESRIHGMRHPRDTRLASIPIGKPAPSFHLSTLNGVKFEFDGTHSRLSILIFFSPHDCSLCLIESLIWRELDDEYETKEVSIVGIVDGNIDTKQTRMFCSARRIGFPVLIDKGSLVRHAFGVKHTPIRVIIDASGKIVDADVSTNNPEKHRIFKDKVATLLLINSIGRNKG